MMMLSAHFTYHQWQILCIYIYIYNITTILYVYIYICMYSYVSVTKIKIIFDYTPSLSTKKNIVNSHGSQVEKPPFVDGKILFTETKKVQTKPKRKNTFQITQMENVFLLKIFRFGFLPAKLPSSLNNLGILPESPQRPSKPKLPLPRAPSGQPSTLDPRQPGLNPRTPGHQGAWPKPPTGRLKPPPVALESWHLVHHSELQCPHDGFGFCQK